MRSALLALVLLAGCVAPRPIPTHPDAGVVDGDGGICNRAGECETIEERCAALKRDLGGIVDLAECLDGGAP